MPNPFKPNKRPVLHEVAYYMNFEWWTSNDKLEQNMLGPITESSTMLSRDTPANKSGFKRQTGTNLMNNQYSKRAAEYTYNN